MERLINYEKKFVNLHTNIVLVILVHSIFLLFQGRVEDVKLVLLSSLIITHTANIILLKFNFFNKKIYVYVIKFIQISTAGMACFSELSYPFVAMMGIVIYFLLVIEILIVSDVTTVSSKVVLGLSSTIPLILSFVHALLIKRLSVNVVFDSVYFIIFLVTVMVGLITIIASNIEELQYQISVQTKLFNESKQANETLLITQQKFKNANEQLAKQKMDLETAYKKINRTNSEMFIQTELLRYISSSLEIDELMEVVTDSVIGAIGVDTCSIIIYDINKSKYHYKVKSTFKKNYVKIFKELLKEGCFNELMGSNSKILIDNRVIPGKYQFLDDRQVGSLMIIPLVRENNTYGLLIAEQKSYDTFSKDNMQFFEGIVTQINIAISNANLYAKMEDMAIRDGLTGVYNRAYLSRKLNELISEAVNTGNPISIALFDIDKLKKINDTYGHLFGDKAIKTIAKLSNNIAMLHNGLLGRFGGEEFVIILPNTPVDRALKIVQEIHTSIQEEKIYHNDIEVHINVSIGLTCYPETCKNPDELLNRADWSMYYSKQNGRGRITIDNDEIKAKVNM